MYAIIVLFIISCISSMVLGVVGGGWGCRVEGGCVVVFAFTVLMLQVWWLALRVLVWDGSEMA